MIEVKPYLDKIKHFSQLAWKHFGHSLLVGGGFAFLWFLLMDDLVFTPIIAVVLTTLHWLDHRYPSSGDTEQNLAHIPAIEHHDPALEGGLHSLSVYHGLGKGYESYYLHEETLRHR